MGRKEMTGAWDWGAGCCSSGAPTGRGFATASGVPGNALLIELMTVARVCESSLVHFPLSTESSLLVHLSLGELSWCVLSISVTLFWKRP